MFPVCFKKENALDICPVKRLRNMPVMKCCMCCIPCRVNTVNCNVFKQGLITVKLYAFVCGMEEISLLYSGWITFTAFTTMPLFEGSHIYHMTHVDIIHYHAIYCRSERRAGGCLPLALGPAFTQGGPTICIIATPARTTDKQASG